MDIKKIVISFHLYHSPFSSCSVRIIGHLIRYSTLRNTQCLLRSNQLLPLSYSILEYIFPPSNLTKLKFELLFSLLLHNLSLYVHPSTWHIFHTKTKPLPPFKNSLTLAKVSNIIKLSIKVIFKTEAIFIAYSFFFKAIFVY